MTTRTPINQSISYTELEALTGIGRKTISKIINNTTPFPDIRTVILVALHTQSSSSAFNRFLLDRTIDPYSSHKLLRKIRRITTKFYQSQWNAIPKVEELFDNNDLYEKIVADRITCFINLHSDNFEDLGRAFSIYFNSVGKKYPFLPLDLVLSYCIANKVPKHKAEAYISAHCGRTLSAERPADKASCDLVNSIPASEDDSFYERFEARSDVRKAMYYR